MFTFWELRVGGTKGDVRGFRGSGRLEATILLGFRRQYVIFLSRKIWRMKRNMKCKLEL